MERDVVTDQEYKCHNIIDFESSEKFSQ